MRRSRSRATPARCSTCWRAALARATSSNSAPRSGSRRCAGGLDDLIEIREGDALTTLRTGLPDTIDLVLLDGAKALYPDILDLVESRLKPGAFVVADNADYSPDYLARVRAPANGYLSVPFGGDVELSMRLG